MEFKVSKMPNETLALNNAILVNPADMSSKSRYITINDTFVFTTSADKAMESGHLGTSAMHRKWAGLGLNQTVKVGIFYLKDPGKYFIDFMILQLEPVKRLIEVELNSDNLGRLFLESFAGHIFSTGQILVLESSGVYLSATIMEIKVAGASRGRDLDLVQSLSSFGVFSERTVVRFTAPGDKLTLVGNSIARPVSAPIIKAGFKFCDLGIGGLDDEFSTIFRRAFVSRIYPPAILERLDISHVRGVLLFGPPGTGKTLIARQIGQMLNAREPKVINGPQILNRYVGQSEENIRNLFKDAEEEYRAKGDASLLHIIIFDELDAICRQRGSRNDGTGVGDSVVNQLLSKMDGVDMLNNILVIGMTNRRDLIDEALLRPGRFEVQIEIGLPDEKGRLQILNIHTDKMRKNLLLKSDVDLDQIAKITRNFSGAEIAGLVKSAASFALNKHVHIDKNVSVSEKELEKVIIGKGDFELALEEVKPCFGVDTSGFSQFLGFEYILYNDRIQEMIEDLRLMVKQVEVNKNTNLSSVLLHGRPGCGISSLSAKICMESDFPFVKCISPDGYIGLPETLKSVAISKVFNDAYKSAYAIIMIDDIERMVEYSSLGPRYSNTVLQTLMVLIKKPPPQNKKLLVIGTTSHATFLYDVGLFDIFISFFEIFYLNKEDVLRIIKECGVFCDEERVDIERRLGSVSIGIKRLYFSIRMAEETEKIQRVSKLLSLIRE